MRFSRVLAVTAPSCDLNGAEGRFAQGHFRQRRLGNGASQGNILAVDQDQPLQALEIMKDKEQEKF